MNLPEEAPKLPLAPFLVGDAALIATAVLIGRYCPAPIGPWPLLAIALCVIAGAVLAAIPFIVNYAKRQDAELTERQNQIAALARVTAESAEQLSIAAASLHGIAQASSGNLKFIEQLPAQLQDHVKVLQKQLADTAKATLVATKEETAHIDAAADRITRAVADLAKLETAARQQLVTVNETLAQAGGQLATAASAALMQARTQALADFDEHLAAAVIRAIAQADAALPEPPPRKRTKPSAEKNPATEETLASSPAPESSIPAPAPVEGSVAVTPPEEKSAIIEPAIEQATPPPTPAPIAAVTEEILSTSTPANPSPEEVPVSEPPAPRTRAPKPTPPEDTGFDLGLAVETPESERSISSDGFTRLVATAYIGIGNKLFIRGEGPGLSWDKGVPLQFVSIGKWRWETADATAPIRAKLYKNDQTECTSVGTLTLDPGHQHEVNAGF